MEKKCRFDSYVGVHYGVCTGYGNIDFPQVRFLAPDCLSRDSSVVEHITAAKRTGSIPVMGTLIIQLI